MSAVTRPRPKQVTVAVLVLAAWVLIQAAASRWPSHLGWLAYGTPKAAPSSAGSPSSGSLAGLGIFALLWFQILRGRNWARIVYVGIILIEIGGFTYICFSDQGLSVGMVAVDFLCVLSQAVAVALLFLLPGSSWFAKQKN